MIFLMGGTFQWEVLFVLITQLSLSLGVAAGMKMKSIVPQHENIHIHRRLMRVIPPPALVLVRPPLSLLMLFFETTPCSAAVQNLLRAEQH